MKKLILILLFCLLIIQCSCFSPQNRSIHDAADNFDFERVQLLVKENPELVFTCKDKYNWTPLHRLAGAGHKRIFGRILLKKHAIPEFSAEQSRKAVETARILISSGADVNAKTKDGWTALSLASGRGTNELVVLLLEEGADIEAGDENLAISPLRAAVINNRLETARILIENGVDVNRADLEYGKTPLHLAMENKNKDMIDLLLKAGANPYLADQNGVTVVSSADENHNREISQLIEKNKNNGKGNN
ncbi:MAG: ankyrin repeat domain-containing protein [Vulcanimicrobiota bacterium]